MHDLDLLIILHVFVAYTKSACLKAHLQYAKLGVSINYEPAYLT